MVRRKKDPSKIRQEDRLPYETIMELHEQGRDLCGYVRNPLRTMIGKCGLNGYECRAITTNHRDCTNCLDYFLKNYGVTI